MKRIVVFFFLLLFNSDDVRSQAGSSEDRYHEKVTEYANSNFDSTLYYARKLQDSRNHCHSLFGHYFEAKVAYAQGEYDSCEKQLFELLRKVKQEKKPSTFVYSEKMVGKTYDECIKVLCINIYGKLFYIKKNQGKFPEALKYNKTRGDFVEQLSEKDTYYLRNRIAVQRCTAELQKNLGNYKEALRVFNRINHEIHQIEMSKGDHGYEYFQKEKAFILIQLGGTYQTLYRDNHRFADSVEHYYNASFLLTQEFDPSNNTNLYHNLRMSEFQLMKKEYSRALKFANNANDFYENEDQKVYLYELKATIFSNLSQPDSAIHYAKKYLNRIWKLNGYDTQIHSAYSVLAENYFLTNELDSAYKYSNLGLDLVKNELSQKQETYALVSESKTNEFIDLNSKINKKRLEYRNQYIAVILFSSLFLLVLVVLFFRSRRKQKNRFELLQKRFDTLEITTKIKSKSTLDEDVSRKILNDLSEIELSDLFLDQDFNASNLAKLLNTNTTYLSQIINEHKGKSFRKYLTELRMNSLLKSLEEKPIQRLYSIEALGNSIGYSNASSFSRAFKNYLGTSPSEYLKKKYGEV